jgi:hypothetical protein
MVLVVVCIEPSVAEAPETCGREELSTFLASAVQPPRCVSFALRNSPRQILNLDNLAQKGCARVGMLASQQ